jgi:hypothetical protein
MDAGSTFLVHEWGTITTRHQPDEIPLGRLNRIEQSEVLPSFVYNFEPDQTQSEPERSLRKKSLIPGRPGVTMRLETQVMYFIQIRITARMNPSKSRFLSGEV